MCRVCLPTHTDIEDTHVSQSITVYYIFVEPATFVAKARHSDPQTTNIHFVVKVFETLITFLNYPVFLLN